MDLPVGASCCCENFAWRQWELSEAAAVDYVDLGRAAEGPAGLESEQEKASWDISIEAAARP